MKKLLCTLLALLISTQLTACGSAASKAFKDANRAFQNGEWSEAKSLAEQVEKDYPDTKEAKKASDLIKKAESQLDYEEAASIAQDAKNSYAEGDWKAVINAYEKVEKLAPDSDILSDLSNLHAEAENNWKQALFDEMKSAYANEDWGKSVTCAIDILQYFPGTAEAAEAETIQNDAKENARNANDSARKENARSQLRISRCWVIGPDSANGYELHINYENKSEKTIKYFRFGVTFYNAVGDPIKTWRIDSIEYCEDVGPIGTGAGQSGNSGYWGKYYDSPIDHPEIVYIHVEYTDGSTWELSDDEISAVQY